MRTLLLAALVAVLGAAAVGCGDDGATTPTSVDMSMPHDLSGQLAACSATGVAQSCATASTINGCYACNLTNLVCARVCSLLTQSCPSGQTCTEFTFADGGTSSGVAVEGAGCSGYGYCR